MTRLVSTRSPLRFVGCSLWFTAFQQEKPLVQQIRLLNAARKEAINHSPGFLTTPVRSGLSRLRLPPNCSTDEVSLDRRTFYGSI